MCNLSQGIKEDALAEGREAGIAEGREANLLEQISKKLAKGKSLSQIADECEETEERIQGQKSGPEPLSRSQAFRIIKKAANYYGFEQNISCHSLRKTFGYFAWKNGTPPALLMSIYNHSSYEITKRYLGIDQLEKDKVFLETFL